MTRAAAIVAFYSAVVVVPSLICWLKGKRLWAILGCLSLWHVIPMIRLAKPDSWWAHRYYDNEKIRRARERFNDDELDDEPIVAAAYEFTAESILEQDEITRTAWKNAQTRLRA